MTDINKLLEKLGVSDELTEGDLSVVSPIDGSELGHVSTHSVDDVDMICEQSLIAFKQWQSVPAPVRGELIRLFGEQLRQHKDELGRLVTLECGKIYQEGLGEVQEMIDICDFAVGLSRQLYGLTIASERPQHKMTETWHPIGPVGIISAFNFPVAVWAWNTAIALVCGDSVVWKPSEQTPLTALACQALLNKAAAQHEHTPQHLSQVVIGDAAVGERLVDNPNLPVISATGSCEMGRQVAPRVASRFGKTILELGGNNAIIVAPSADLEIAIPAIVFGAVGTAGQRCTSTRRLFVHKDIAEDVVRRLENAYKQLPIGNPLDEGTLVGPLINQTAADAMDTKLSEMRSKGARVIGGEPHEHKDGVYRHPAIVVMPDDVKNEMTETFAPILFVFTYDDFEDAIARNNAVPQGLSSAVFTNDIREAETFTSSGGSDCGIANINIGTSGAEIGGAFGGEKETGGGRESGSDAWKGYMRRSTSTSNYSRELPLAQGIKFELS